MKRLGDLPTWILATLPLFLFLLFQIPLSIYRHNSYDFGFSLTDVLMEMILLVLLCSVTVSIMLGATLRGRAAIIVQNVFLVLTVLLWIEANLLTWQYGALDGTPIQYNAFFYSALLDSAIWAAAIYVAVRLHARFLQPVALFLLLFGSLTSAVHLAQVMQLESPHSAASQFDPHKRFQFSQAGNIILVVWDTVQANIAYEILQERPELTDQLQGFRFYRNTVGAFAGTRASIPLLLTGKFFNNDRPYLDYIQASYNAQSLPARVKQAGYRSHPYPWSPQTVPVSGHLADNLVPHTRSLTDSITDMARLQEVALFAGLPHFMKSWIYRNGRWTYVAYLRDTAWFRRLQTSLETLPEDAGSQIDPGDEQGDEDTQIIRLMIKQIHVTNAEPTFTFLHLQGAHAPFDLDEHGGNLHTLGRDFSTYRSKLTYKLKLMGKFVDVLKDKAIYKQSLVIFVGDHGSGNDHQLRRFKDPHSNEWLSDNLEVKARGTPFVMIKDVGSTTGFEATDQPISLADLKEYILGTIENRPSVEGRLGVRRYVHHEWRTSFEESLSGYSEYAIAGHSWLDSSWIPLHIHHFGESQDDCPFERYKRLELLGQVSTRNSTHQRIPFSTATIKSDIVVVVDAGHHGDIALSLNGSALQPVGLLKGGQRSGDFIERDIVFFERPLKVTRGTLAISSKKRLDRVSVLEGFL